MEETGRPRAEGLALAAPQAEREDAEEARRAYLEHCRSEPRNRKTAGKLWRAYVEAASLGGPR